MNDKQILELKTLRELSEKTGMLGTPKAIVVLKDGKYRIKNSDPMIFEEALGYLRGFIHGAEFMDDKLREEDTFPEYTKGEIAAKAIEECDSIDLREAVKFVIESGKFEVSDFLEAATDSEKHLLDEISFMYDVIVFSPKTMQCKYEVLEAIKKSSQMTSGEISNSLFSDSLFYWTC